MDRARALGRLKFSDNGFRLLTLGSAFLVLCFLLGVVISLFIGAWPAFREFGVGFLFSDAWSPPKEKFGAATAIYGTLVTSLIAMLIAVPVGLGIAVFLTELCWPPLRRPIGVAIELLAGIPSIIYGIWGVYYFRPVMQAYIQPFLINTLGNVPGIGFLFAGPPLGYGVLTAGLVLALMILPFITAVSRDVFDTVPAVLKEAAYGVGATTFEVVGNIVIPYTRVGVIGGVMLALGRALGETMAVTFVIGNATKISVLDPRARHDHLGDDRQPVRRRGSGTVHLVAARARLHPVRHHVPGSRGRTLDAGAPRAEGMRPMANLYPGRRRRNVIWTVLAYAATALGLSMLAIILATLLWNGFGGLSLDVFTKNTAPPGSRRRSAQLDRRQLHHDGDRPRDRRAARHSGGHLSRRIRRATRGSPSVVRFINDILLSAPSIVVGLFIYELLVVPVGHFSALAGGVALAVLGAPIMVRTTEDMLNLVPNPLREAASALGMPRSLVIRNVAYRAVALRLHHRRSARDRTHDRRDRAADLHRARQFAVHPRSARADVEPAAHHLRIRAQPLCRAAEARLDGRADPHLRGPGAEHHGPRALRLDQTEVISEKAFAHEQRCQGREAG